MFWASQILLKDLKRKRKHAGINLMKRSVPRYMFFLDLLVLSLSQEAVQGNTFAK